MQVAMSAATPDPRPLAALRGVRRRCCAVVDLDLRPCEVLALLGANGAGKSTAVGLMPGLGTPDAGTATLFGQPAG